MHYDLAQQQDSFIQTTNDNEMRRTVTFQQEQSEVNQQEELVPPKVPPRVHPKPILRTSSSDQVIHQMLFMTNLLSTVLCRI